ncbi:MAG: hypothetical protein NT033_10770 [Candidatus Omnitrophica bacterium]|nr:hypothetical protein [Candidatus Omnitrophota bacterium]
MPKNKKAQSKTPNAKRAVFILMFFVCLVVFVCRYVFAQERFTYDQKGKRNPFIPLITADGRLVQLDAVEDKRSDDILVEGIIYDEKGVSFAVVNSNVVKVGDRVLGFEVMAIEKNKLVLKKDDKVREVILSKEAEE